MEKLGGVWKIGANGTICFLKEIYQKGLKTTTKMIWASRIRAQYKSWEKISLTKRNSIKKCEIDKGDTAGGRRRPTKRKKNAPLIKLNSSIEESGNIENKKEINKLKEEKKK